MITFLTSNPGEAVDPHYKRFLNGLGITDLMILPHFQAIRNERLDGKRIIEDITYEDSWGKRMYALVDGSYVMVSEQETRLYGEAYLIQDGTMKNICEENKSLRLENK